LKIKKILSGIGAGEAKRSENFEAKRSEKKRKTCFSFSLEHAKTKRNGSYFASFRFEAKKIIKRNRRTLVTGITQKIYLRINFEAGYSDITGLR
jgi:hypothetical protein